MKLVVKAAVLLVALSSGVVLAQDKQTTGTSSQMSQVKSMAMKERHAMMEMTKSIDTQVTDIQKSVKAMDSEQARALDAQVAALQKNVKALEAQLAKAPKYFDDPTSSSLHP